MELSDELYELIEEYTEQGNDYCDDEQWNEALECFNKALELLPEPKDQWEASTWIYTALGDAYFFLYEYEVALDNFKRARMCPDGMANPFILLRLGQSYYEVGDFENAKRHFIETYMMEGEDIFDEEDEKYFELIRELVD